MAHFAELDESNVVIRVVVISNDDISDSDGTEHESLGIELCTQIVGPGNWVQTSFNNNFRGVFGEPGFVFVPESDVFYNPTPPFPSWELGADYRWSAPIEKPDDGQNYQWDEASLSWVVPVMKVSLDDDMELLFGDSPETP